MRKRKAPIIPVTILIICAAVALGFNYNAGINQKAEAEEKAKPTTDISVGQPRPASDPKDIASQVKKQAGSAATAAPHIPPMARNRMMHPRDGAAIELPKPPAQTKPVPNETAIAGQWYDAESAKH
jgi:hypothetical protein